MSSIDDLLYLRNIISENKKVGGLDVETVQNIQDLWNEYKLAKSCENTSIITADFGCLGSVVIRKIKEYEKEYTFKYEGGGEYDLISVIHENTTRILWTDYKNIEPYNRNSGLYCDGASFEHLGSPVIEKDEYREFYKTSEHGGNLGFGVCGFNYNNFYKTVSFGMCVENTKVDEFILKLRNIINK